MRKKIYDTNKTQRLSLASC